MIMQYAYIYTQKGECETKRPSPLTKPSENPLFKGIFECEGCFESLTYPSLTPHSTLTWRSFRREYVCKKNGCVVLIWVIWEGYGRVMWGLCERNVRGDVRDEITRSPLYKGVLIEKSEGCWIWSHGCKARTFLSAVLTLSTVSPLDVAYIVVAAMKDTLVGSRPSNPMVILQFVLFNNL